MDEIVARCNGIEVNGATVDTTYDLYSAPEYATQATELVAQIPARTRTGCTTRSGDAPITPVGRRWVPSQWEGAA